ncbi:hypothetical protein SAMN02745945_02189 [Peptoclostridium litorale DSM 5388]|uniref:Uncharacterized protein n=1 Tax=Peptoclostridium litorale DSM 5388 TaxID=1121324 RepID=A0A069RFK5_PEPLI|nr:hypothetical protein [Peptoclostridium litorale]KDR95796.1 hypothetical protein CLIT_10c05230 [Peptoclostridium litorale DSM 5388]SIO21141.1 hypothetical protein SAMN02745945_02189 [Peptoclostridium litorale DSM 5388]
MMIKIFSWTIAICVGMLFVGSAVMSMGFVEAIIYFNISNIIWYVGIMSTLGLLAAIIIDRISTKKEEEKSGFKKY